MNEVNTVKTGAFEYQGENYNYNFFTDIGVQKKVAFVNGVVNTVVSEDHYHSVLRGIIFGFQLINVFSDALDNLSEEDKTFSLAEIEDIVMNTTIVDTIMANARAGLMDELQEAVDRDIEYKTGIHRNPLGEAVASLFGTLEQRVKDIDLDGLMGFAEAFKGISDGDMTPEKLWDAYANSKAFEKVRAESVEKTENVNEKIVKIAEVIEETPKPKKRGRKPKTKKEETVSEVTENDNAE